MQISDSDIEWAERILIPDNCVFNDERRAFIKCMENRDVIACPGSGKTTALLAKLLILASRLPFPDGRGICVLTHTNVAINQIKSSANPVTDSLFRYPNFFGTIQEFANKFLAIPAYIARFGQRHIHMDNDLYKENIRKTYFNNYNLQKNPVVYRQLKDRIENLDWADQHPFKIKFLQNLQFQFDKDYIHYARLDTGRRILRGDRDSISYEDVHNAKYGLLKEGYLQYQDAFPLAVSYLEDNPCLSKAFDHRFAFLFIDEAQDTNATQMSMLNLAFPEESNTVTQCVGDPNQAIYNFVVHKDMEWSPKPAPSHFSDTIRFGDSIAHILATVRINDQISLKPNTDIPSLQPHILCFDLNQVCDVLPTFAELIRQNDFSTENNSNQNVYKAIGFVGKDKGDDNKLSIRSYFSKFQSAIRRKKFFSNLLSYFHSQSSSVDGFLHGSRGFRNAILRGITRALTIAGHRHPDSNRPFSPSTFLDWLQHNDIGAYEDLLSMLAGWIIKFERGEVTQLQLRDNVADYLRAEWDAPAMDDFISSNEVEFSEQEQESDNVFRDGDIEIEIGTVHSVKGETHTATLYLDTFYQNHSLHFLLPFLKGEYPEDELNKTHHIEHLKVAHVAMSRPTHLLCFACEKSQIAGHEEDLEQNGWVIRDVKNIID